MWAVLIFGDSYVAARWSYARLLGASRMGRGGTGFVRASGDRLPYPDRLPDLLAADADVVVVQATGNDALCDLELVEKEAAEFLRPVVERFPRVILLGPMWALDGSEHLPELRDRMRRVADDLDVPLIDALGWLRPALIGPDGAHPTRRGHAVIAWRLARALRR